MESVTDALLVVVLMVFPAGFLMPMFSIGAVLSFHALEMPDYPPPYIGFLAAQNDPDHPKHLLGRLMGDRYSPKPHPNHVLAGSMNVFGLAMCNVVPVVALVSPYALLAVGFFLWEGLWFWWLRGFVVDSRRSE